MLTTMLNSIDTFVYIATTTSSITLSLKKIGLRSTPFSAAAACGLSIGNKIIFEIDMQKCNKYKNHYQKVSKDFNPSINFIEKVYKIIYLIKINMNLFVIVLLSIWMKQKMNLFYIHEFKNLNLFIKNAIKNQPRS